MLPFREAAPGQEPDPVPDRALWRWLLFAAAAGTAACSTLPWVRVRFESLFGSEFGPPGWHGTAGFTCLCSAVLVALLALVEDGSQSSRRAARPGSLVLAVITAVVVAAEWSTGPGMLRGVSATWTAGFHALVASVPVLLWACLARHRAAASGDGERPELGALRVRPVRRRGPGTRSPRPRTDSRDTPAPDPNGPGSCG